MVMTRASAGPPTAQALRSRRQRRQDASPGAGPFMERFALVFLVGRVDVVVLEREPDEQAVHAEFALEGADNRDGRAADQHRRLPPFGLERLARPAQRLVLDRQRNGGAPAVADEF